MGKDKKQEEELPRAFRQSTLEKYPDLGGADLSPPDIKAIETTIDIMAIGKELLANDSVWKTEKERESYSFFSTKCPQLKNAKVIKFQVSLSRGFMETLEDLMDFGNCASWNQTMETYEVLKSYPAGFWILYTRASDEASKAISKRDFTTCCTKQIGENEAYYFGAAARLPEFPPTKKCERAEQKILAIRIYKVTETTCKLTQVLSIKFGGLIPQAAIDAAMVNSLTQYAKCLQKRANALNAA